MLNPCPRVCRTPQETGGRRKPAQGRISDAANSGTRGEFGSGDRTRCGTGVRGGTVSLLVEAALVMLGVSMLLAMRQRR